MISNILFNRGAMPDLEKSLDTYSLRQKTITNNIANAMTPGYKAQRVSFEEEYRKSLYPDDSMKLITNSDKHMQKPGPKPLSQINPEVGLKDDPVNDSGWNNVDIDREMAEMAENQLRYEMSTKLLAKRFSGIKKAISGRV